MKVSFKDLENGTYAAIEMSWADICDNNLYACFSRNNINQPVLLKKGAFFNFVGNYILTEFQDKYKVFANVNQRQPQYDIIGDAEKFIVVYAMIPQQELTEVKDRIKQVSKEAPVGLQKDNTWTPTHETTVGKKGPAKKKEASSDQSVKVAGTSIPQEELLSELEVKFPSVQWREHNGRIAITEDGSGSNGVASDGKPLWTYYPPGDNYTDYPDASTHRELFDFLDSRGWYVENQNAELAYLFPIYSNSTSKESRSSDAVKVAGNYSDIVRKLSEWHGGQGSAVYSLMSQLYNGYHVSKYDIESAISELEGDLNRPEGTYDNEQWVELSGLISDLEVMLEENTSEGSDITGEGIVKESLSAEAVKWAWGSQGEILEDSVKIASTGDAEDLELYVENTANLYKAYTLPNLKYIKKKIDSGTYDASLAPKLWMNLVNAGARQYANEEAMRGGRVSFPVGIRMQVAENLAETYYNAVVAGEYSNYFESEAAKNKPAGDIQASAAEALSKLAGYTTTSEDSMRRSHLKKASEMHTAEELLRIFGNSGMTQEQAVELESILKISASHNEAHDLMKRINGLIGGHGVEGVEAENYQIDNYYYDFVFDYVNMGDTYATTVIHDHIDSEFVITTVGDQVQYLESKGITVK